MNAAEALTEHLKSIERGAEAMKKYAKDARLSLQAATEDTEGERACPECGARRDA